MEFRDVVRRRRMVRTFLDQAVDGDVLELILLAVVDEGLGAVFFGMSPKNVPRVRDAFGIPDDWEPIGAIAIGQRDEDPIVGSAATRPRRPLDEVVHRGRW